MGAGSAVFGCRGMSAPPIEPDWRRPETYAYTATLTRTGWAWEFLRRNPTFRQDLLLRYPSLLGSTGEVSERRDLKRWGICFRRRPDV